jgi:hypothetical protein
MFPGYVKPTKAMIDAGVLYRRYPDGSTLIGVGPSRGGLTFNPGRAIRNIEFDGKTSDIAGLDRVITYDSRITGTLIDFSHQNFGMYEPGHTSGVSGSATRITPIQATEFLQKGAYIHDLLFIRRVQDNSIAITGFPMALVVEYELSGEDKNEGGAQVTLKAMIPDDAENINDCPYRHFLTPDLSTLDALFPEFWDVAGYIGNGAE